MSRSFLPSCRCTCGVSSTLAAECRVLGYHSRAFACGGVDVGVCWCHAEDARGGTRRTCAHTYSQCVCVCVCVCMYTHTCMHAYVHTYTHACMHTYMLATTPHLKKKGRVSTPSEINRYTCVLHELIYGPPHTNRYKRCIRAQGGNDLFFHTHTHVYVHTHTHTHTHIPTHTDQKDAQGGTDCLHGHYQAVTRAAV